MSYTPTPEEARYIASVLRARTWGGPGLELADKLDPPKVTAEQARVAVASLRQWSHEAIREGAADLLFRFIDQYEAKP